MKMINKDSLQQLAQKQIEEMNEELAKRFGPGETKDTVGFPQNQMTVADLFSDIPVEPSEQP